MSFSEKKNLETCLQYLLKKHVQGRKRRKRIKKKGPLGFFFFLSNEGVKYVQKEEDGTKYKVTDTRHI